jgi:hypothetical protein
MNCVRKRRRPGNPSGRKCYPAILALSLLASIPTHAQESTERKPGESMPASSRPAKLYTEEEALVAAMLAAETAVGVAVPLAVQAAVAEEQGKAAAQQALNKAAADAFQRQSRVWRSAALLVTAVSLGSLADGVRGAMYGTASGAAAALLWWLVEKWPLQKEAGLTQ